MRIEKDWEVQKGQVHSNSQKEALGHQTNAEGKNERVAPGADSAEWVFQAQVRRQLQFRQNNHPWVRRRSMPFSFYFVRQFIMRRPKFSRNPSSKTSKDGRHWRMWSSHLHFSRSSSPISSAVCLSITSRKEFTCPISRASSTRKTSLRTVCSLTSTLAPVYLSTNHLLLIASSSTTRCFCSRVIGNCRCGAWLKKAIAMKWL